MEEKSLIIIFAVILSVLLDFMTGIFFKKHQGVSFPLFWYIFLWLGHKLQDKWDRPDRNTADLILRGFLSFGTCLIIFIFFMAVFHLLRGAAEHYLAVLWIDSFLLALCLSAAVNLFRFHRSKETITIVRAQLWWLVWVLCHGFIMPLILFKMTHLYVTLFYAMVMASYTACWHLRPKQDFCRSIEVLAYWPRRLTSMFYGVLANFLGQALGGTVSPYGSEKRVKIGWYGSQKLSAKPKKDFQTKAVLFLSLAVLIIFFLNLVIKT